MSTLAKILRDTIQVLDFGPPHKSPIYLQGSLHANESFSTLVLQSLALRLESDPPKRHVRIVPHCNPLGWAHYLETSDGRQSVNGRNWNRIFGTDAEERYMEDLLASYLWDLSSIASKVIDVHTPEFGMAHAYAPTASRRLATFDDIPYAFYGTATVGPFDEAHVRLRSDQVDASVTLELPSMELPTNESIEYWSGRLYEEVLATPNVPHDSPALSGQMVDLIPLRSGICLVRCEPGVVVNSGLPVLEVVSPDGEREVLLAPSTCVPVCFRRATAVSAGSWAVRVIVLESATPTVGESVEVPKT